MEDLSKKDTTVLKGFAIMFMLFFHLFDQPEKIQLLKPFIYINGVSLVYLLAKYAYLCVPIYIFLSGYGLFISNQNRKKGARTKRILSLLLNYWLILVIFVSIGFFISPSAYPGSILKLVSNITTWSYSYNQVWWFLFPYLVLMLLSPYIMDKVKKVSPALVFFTTGVLYIVAYVLLKRYSDFLVHDTIYQKPLLCLTLLFPFCIGAVFAKYRLFTYTRKCTKGIRGKNLLFVGVIILSIAIRVIIPVSIFNPLFAVIFITCVASMNRCSWLDKPLVMMGKHSTNIWLIHAFFCYYFFKTFIYSFKYPPIVFMVLVFISLLSSYLLNIFHQPLNKKLKNYLDTIFQSK